jgi:adenylate cyclase
MLLPAGRIVGNDGRYVSARQICDETGIDLELLRAIQRALGLPRADDPDAVILLRADSEAAARAKIFIDMGLSREQVIAVTRVLGYGLAQTAEAMRQVVLEAGYPTRRARITARAGLRGLSATGVATARPIV